MRARRSLPARRAAILLAIAASTPSEAATVTGRLTIDGAPAPQAVVALRGGASAATPEAPPSSRRAVMDQKHLAFVPGVLAVPRGTVVEFTNSDDVEHNVFSPSEVAGAFDLGTYAPGESREIALDRPGAVHILCNIHMEMEARIVVLEERWFAVTGADGSFAIPDVPAGEYAIALWSDDWLPGERKVVVASEADVRVDLAVER